MRKYNSRILSGAALVALSMTLTARAVSHNRITETTMLMVATFFAVAIAFAVIDPL